MGLLVAGFDYSAFDEDEFNEWYDTEHVPERRATPGFINCERWVAADGSKISIATYDLETLDVLRSDAYLRIGGENLSPWSKRVVSRVKRVCRFEADQMPPGNVAAPQGAGGLMMFAMNVVPEAEADFNAWYDEEHVPRLSRVPGCLSARRFRIRTAVSEGQHRYLALYHLESAEVCSSKAWEEAAVTPWTLKIRPQTRDRLRIPLTRYQPRAR
jgi:hypothetical protein